MLSVGTQRRPVVLVEAKEENENTSLECRSYRKAKESKTISPEKKHTQTCGSDDKGVTHYVPHLSKGSVDLH